MSMEIHVLFGGKLPSKAALTRSFRELGFPLSFRPGAASLEQHKGYLPMRLRGEESGVEFDTSNDRKEVEEITGDDIDPQFTRSANFRFSGDEKELAVARCVAAALAKLVNGIVFDDEEGELQTVEQAINQARKQIAAIAPKSKVRGTRPADIKHYLKPLLQMRSDLVLVDRLLLIRPVRHLIRGAGLDRMLNEYGLTVRRFVLPLFAGSPPGMPPGETIGGVFGTWHPHFESLLIDRLVVEVFSEVGQISTLVDFARTTNSWEAAINAFVLAGQADEAAERVRQVVRQVERMPVAPRRFGAVVREHFERVTSDVAALCAECHAKEAQMAKAMKLEHLWEPAPFPVELAQVRRDDRTADPSFALTPWPARPPSLWQDLPRQPGEVRYAKDWYWQGDDLLLLVALTAAEAEERYWTNGQYALAERLPDDVAIFVHHSVELDFYPPQPRAFPDRQYRVCLQTTSHQVTATAKSELDCRDSAEIDYIQVRKRDSGRCIWRLSVYRDGEVRVDDDRDGKTLISRQSSTPAECERRTVRGLTFGNNLVFADRIRSLLQTAGFGELS